MVFSRGFSIIGLLGQEVYGQSSTQHFSMAPRTQAKLHGFDFHSSFEQQKGTKFS